MEWELKDERGGVGAKDKCKMLAKRSPSRSGNRVGVRNDSQSREESWQHWVQRKSKKTGIMRL